MGVGLEMPPHPRLYVAVHRVGADDQEIFVGASCNRQVGLDAAALVDPLGVDDAPGWHVDVVAAQAIQLGQGVRPLDLELGHEGHVHGDDGFAAGTVLGADVLEGALPREGVVLNLGRGHPGARTSRRSPSLQTGQSRLPPR